MMRLLAIVAAATLLAAATARAEEQEAVMDEIVIESTFEIDFRLELPKESSVQIMIDRLTAKEEAKRAFDLEIANRTPVTTILDLTKYIPVPAFSGSSKPVDTFFQENYMHPDLNPGREKNPLLDNR